jgi:hypothetical protein
MITLEDARWSNLTGGYRTPLDPRPLLKRLETDSDTTEVWQELWDELHHQGDIGEASFAAVPFLVRNYRKRGVLHWNTYAIVAIIELARGEGKTRTFLNGSLMTTSTQSGNLRRSAPQKYCRPKPQKMFAPYLALLPSRKVFEPMEGFS